MPNWKKIITSGSDAAFNSVTASNGLFGTASWAQSASQALTSSYISGLTTVGSNLVTLPNPNAVTYLRVNADNTVSTRTASQLLTDLGILGLIQLVKDFTVYTVSNTTANTIAVSYAVPPNTFQANDFIRLETHIQSNIAGASPNFHLYVNTSTNLTGVTPLGTWGNASGKIGRAHV